jgi:hypothetical protein
MIASIRVANSAGLVTTTAGPDLVHTLGTNRSNVRRSAIIRKILAYNNTGGNVTLQFGSRDGQAVPVFVAYLPTLLVLNGLDNDWQEVELPAIIFSVVAPVPLVAVNVREGNIWVQASAVGVLVTLELEEFGS